MKVPGIRFYPQTVEVDNSGTAPMFIHDHLDEEKSDFHCIFHPIWEYMQEKVIAWDFCVTYGENPIPELKEQFGDALIEVDLRNQILFLNGSFIESWASEVRVFEGAYFTVFNSVPNYELTKKLFWGRNFKLATKNWPDELLLVIEMWDDIFWQIFTKDIAVLKNIAIAHDKNAKIKMYHVNIDDDSPDPRNVKLKQVKKCDFE